MRLSYPTNIKIIRVPCTGKIDILHILHAFEKGADGLYAVGCMEGDCHYTSSEGPRFAAVAVEMVEKIKQLGPNPIKRKKPQAA
jgi:coenzyme F420-reducing hydrogenase delta subunit